MKNKLVLSFAALRVCVATGSGSALAQKLYPVRGPLAEQTPQPVFSGQVRRPMFGPAALFLLLKSWTVANGEVLQGKPKTLLESSVNPAPESNTISLPQPNLAFAWDAVYGEGFFVAHILGKKFGQGVFTGNQGTILQAESIDGRNGVAVDNKGNIYKMVWQ
jgi:hypothetical protein